MTIVVGISHSVECWMSDLSFALESSNSRQCHGWQVPCWEQSRCAACVVPHHRTCKYDLQVTEGRGREAELTEFAAHVDKVVAIRKRTMSSTTTYLRLLHTLT